MGVLLAETALDSRQCFELCSQTTVQIRLDLYLTATMSRYGYGCGYGYRVWVRVPGMLCIFILNCHFVFLKMMCR